MDEENTFSYPRTFQIQIQSPSPQIQRETPIWECLTGQPEDYRSAKLKFKNSTILPPPSQMEARKSSEFKQNIFTQKRKIRSIFFRLRRDNDQRIAKFTATQSNETQQMKYIEKTEFAEYFSPFQQEANKKYLSLERNIKSYLRDYLYKEVKQGLSEADKWIQLMEKAMRKKYEEKVKDRQELMELQRLYEKFGQIDMENSQQGGQQEMGGLRGWEICKKMEQIGKRKELPAGEQIENIYGGLRRKERSRRDEQ